MKKIGTLILSMLHVLLWSQNTSYPLPTTAIDVNTLDQDTFLPPFKYKYVTVIHPQKLYVQCDTSLNNYFQDIEIAKRTPFNKIYTGNNGATLLNSILDVPIFTGFHMGFHQYDLYNYTLDSIKQYRTERTFADMYFSQIFGSQNNFEVGAEFAQPFKNDVRMNLSYRRVLQQGFYKDQGTKTTNLAASLTFYVLKKKWRTTPGMIINNNNEKHNGGVDTLGLNVDENTSIYGLRSNIPVRLSNASTRVESSEFYLVNEYGLKVINADSFSTSIGHIFQYKTGEYRYSDDGIQSARDSNFYNTLLYPIDSRGLRTFNSFSQVSNELFINGSLKWAIGRLSLKYDYYNIHYSNQAAVNDITLRFNGSINAGKALLINTDARLGVGDNAGHFNINGKATFKPATFLVLNVQAEIFRSRIGFTDNQLFVNEQQLYNNDYAAPFGTKIKAGMDIGKINTSVMVGQQVINNYIYRDNNDRPIQDNAILSSTYLSAINRIKIWKLHLESSAFIQTVNKDYLPVPDKFLKSTFYFESKFFRKVMQFRIGAEARLMPGYRMPDYNPLTGQFYYGLTNKKIDYKSLDIYLSAKVSKFRIFVKYENFLNLFDNKLTSFVRNHPIFDANIRFGLRWILID